MVGGRGADTYYVDDPKDEVVETDNVQVEGPGGPASLDLGSAIDRIVSSIDLTLGAFVENLELATGAGNLSGVGNELDNVLVGNASNNTLSGLGGNDHLWGGAGADVLDGGFGFDFAHYDDAPAGFTADLLSPGNSTGDAVGDGYLSIEGLTGSLFNDVLRMDDFANSVWALDTIVTTPTVGRLIRASAAISPG